MNACQSPGCPRTFLAEKRFCSFHNHKANRREPRPIVAEPVKPPQPTVKEWHESRSLCTCDWMHRKAGHYCRACIAALAEEERTVKAQARAR